MPFFLLTFLTPWEYQCAIDRLWKKLVYIFLWMIDINDRFNIYSTIRYYNARHIKDNIYIYEAEAKWNYFRLVTLKIVHPNDGEFCSYDIAGSLDKQYMLAGFCKIWITYSCFLTAHQLTRLDMTTQTCNQTLT